MYLLKTQQAGFDDAVAGEPSAHDLPSPIQRPEPESHMADDIYRSERLCYVPIERSKRYDDFMYELMRDPSTLNFDTALPIGVTRSRVDALISSLGSSARRLLSMYICLYDTTRTPVGMLTLQRRGAEPHAHHGCATLAVSVAAGWRNRGHGGEAIAWALGWAFGWARLHRVEVGCGDWNPGALRLCQRLGFSMEGTRREALWLRGAWRDLHELAMLDHEWRALAAERERERYRDGGRLEEEEEGQRGGVGVGGGTGKGRAANLKEIDNIIAKMDSSWYDKESTL
ncbi:acyl-CoA N-acyltransferase [Biscogniauxia marginata]|nr:acyl-CoA N-acyltransferase [Biscogniauxia marginata]